MRDDTIATEAREQLELAHRLHQEILEAVLRVAAETGRDPGEIASLVSMGGGFSHVLQPLTMRWHEERQRQFMRDQAALDARPEPGPAT